MNIETIKNWLKNYGGYLTSLVLPIIIGFLGAVGAGCRANFYSCFLSSWYLYIIIFSKDLWVVFAMISGLSGSFLFDKYFLQNEVKYRISRQIIGFFAFFWIIPVLIFIAGAFLGIIWIV